MTALAAGSITDAAVVISQAKSKVVHIHYKMHVSSTTEAEVEALKLAHKCDAWSTNVSNAARIEDPRRSLV